jgi:hypothetical protein
MLAELAGGPALSLLAGTYAVLAAAFALELALTPAGAAVVVFGTCGRGPSDCVKYWRDDR